MSLISLSATPRELSSSERGIDRGVEPNQTPRNQSAGLALVAPAHLDLRCCVSQLEALLQ